MIKSRIFDAPKYSYFHKVITNNLPQNTAFDMCPQRTRKVGISDFEFVSNRDKYKTNIDYPVF